MKASKIMSRIVGKGRRTLASNFRRRDLTIDTPVPLISFSFDDAPATAFDEGARILEARDARATYYMSLGLLGRDTEVGTIVDSSALQRAVQAGHELGCHTFDHLDAWHTDTRTYVASVDANQRALVHCVPGYSFRTFAYPKSGATLSVKQALETRFMCCRGGGQTFNIGTVDLNLLSACFLDRRTHVDLGFVRDLIARNARCRGWLIFVTHDVCDQPSPYGCSSVFFGEVVRCAAESGAAMVPVGDACNRLRG